MEGLRGREFHRNPVVRVWARAGRKDDAATIRVRSPFFENEALEGESWSSYFNCPGVARPSTVRRSTVNELQEVLSVKAEPLWIADLEAHFVG